MPRPGGGAAALGTGAVPRAAFILLAWLLVPVVGEGEGEQANESEQVSAVNASIAVMLLGSIGFVMMVLCLINNADKDIKLHSWRVLSSTLSIFVAVLLFQAVVGVLEHFDLMGGEGLIGQSFATFAYSLLLFIALQVFLALLSRAISCRCMQAFFPALPPVGTPEYDEALEGIEVKMKSWAVLLGHVTGFAAIRFWCTLQQAFQESPTGALLVVCLAAISLWVLYIWTDHAREMWAGRDGRKDEHECMWDEEVEETMEDVSALTVSFLIVQCLRFGLGGYLPNAEGELPDGLELTARHAVVLYALGFGFASWGFAIVWLRRHPNAFHEQMKLVCNFVFAWCMLCGTDALLADDGLLLGGAGTLGQVVASLLLTAFAFVSIFCWDAIADSEVTPEAVDRSIRALVDSLGILVGLSWEKCFDSAVAAVAIETREATPLLPPAVTKLGLALVLAGAVLPAWRWYVLPAVFHLESLQGGDEAPKKQKHKDVHKREHLLSLKSNTRLQQALEAYRKSREEERGLTLTRGLSRESSTEGYKQLPDGPRPEEESLTSQVANWVTLARKAEAERDAAVRRTAELEVRLEEVMAIMDRQSAELQATMALLQERQRLRGAGLLPPEALGRLPAVAQGQPHWTSSPVGSPARLVTAAVAVPPGAGYYVATPGAGGSLVVPQLQASPTTVLLPGPPAAVGPALYPAEPVSAMGPVTLGGSWRPNGS